MKIMKTLMLTTVLAGCVLTLPGCSTSAPVAGAPVPALTLDHVQPLVLSVGLVQVSAKPQELVGDTSVRPGAEFGHDLAVMLKTYAEKRLQATPSLNGALLFEVEDTKIVYERVEPQNDMTRWLRLDGHDDYTLSTRIRLTLLNAAGHDQLTNELTLQNTLSLADSLSLAQRDSNKITFIEQYMADLDRRITETLGSRFYLTVPNAPLVGTVP